MAEIFDRMMVFLVTAILMFIVPIVLVANRFDQSTQSYIDSVVINFVDDVRVSGRMTPEAYEKFVYNIDLARPCFDVEIVISRKEVIPGENGDIFSYYKDMYMSEIMENMYGGAGVNDIYLGSGDYIKVIVRATEPTAAQRMLSSADYVPLYVTYGGWVKSSGG